MNLPSTPANIDFELISKYWAEPITYGVLIVFITLLLYPLVKRITATQLKAAVDAIQIAKDLPSTIAQLSDATESLKDVNRELASLKDQIGMLEQIKETLEVTTRNVSDLQKLSEDQPPPPQSDVDDADDGEQEAENWDRVRGLWRDIKDRIEAKIWDIPDGRIRRKYNLASRYQYADVANYLQNDHLLTLVQANALKEMDEMFRSIRNRRTEVTQGVVQRFQDWHDIIHPA